MGRQHAPDERIARWEQELEQQRREIEVAQRSTQANIEVLTQRLGRLQGYVTRLDALGNKLVKMAGIDASEFDFNNPPALGGPEGADGPGPAFAAPDLSGAIDALARQLEDRERQLQVLDHVIMSRNLRNEVHPAGRPIGKGWISSYYGMRSDPFTGRPEFHKGMDFAGKSGSDVIAVGGGMVTWAGKRWGYGNLVEINHGNGYVTRYGHNKEVVVEVGDAVKKGQVIARMGSTGRSTGPHVHFEVIENGKNVNPLKFIQASR
ncbi:MAG: peptidoglycan DD-metalloendopeptidase family protein [Cyanobacteriota bacterium]|nr:peptidoglycan DD-metalloendopeptidase family protein [Cyanobacteriota bacterium]